MAGKSKERNGNALLVVQNLQRRLDLIKLSPVLEAKVPD